MVNFAVASSNSFQDTKNSMEAAGISTIALSENAFAFRLKMHHWLFLPVLLYIVCRCKCPCSISIDLFFSSTFYLGFLIFLLAYIQITRSRASVLGYDRDSLSNLGFYMRWLQFVLSSRQFTLKCYRDCCCLSRQ